MLSVNSQTKTPGTTASVDFEAGPTWSNTGNVAASDNTYATCVVTNGDNSDTLRLTNFGFTIPTGAIVTGMKIEAEYKTDNASGTQKLRLQEVRGDIFINELVNPLGAVNEFAAPTTSDVLNSIGGIQERFKLPFATAAVVNDSDFGIDLVFANTSGGTRTISIDFVQVTLYYVMPKHPENIKSLSTVRPTTLANFDYDAAFSDWANPGNAITSNNTYATVTTDRLNDSETNRLTGRGFDFSSIPDNAIITYIQFSCEFKTSLTTGSASVIMDVSTDVTTIGGIDVLRLINDGFSGAGLTTEAVRTASFVMVETGNGDLLATFVVTGAMLKASTFGVSVWMDDTDALAADVTLSVDDMFLDVEYYVPGNSQTTGALAPTTAGRTDDIGFGVTPVWANESNGLTSNNSYATVAGVAAEGFTNAVMFKGFDFSSIPDNAIIKNIIIHAEAKVSAGSNEWALAGVLGYDVTEADVFSSPFFFFFLGSLAPSAYITTSDSVIDISFYGFDFTKGFFPNTAAFKNGSLSFGVVAVNNTGTGDRTISLDALTVEVEYFESPYKTQRKLPGTVATQQTAGAVVGDVDWTNPSNIVSNNATYAQVALNNQASYVLKATNFGFTIPTGSTIRKVVIEVNGYETNGLQTDTDGGLILAGSLEKSGYNGVLGGIPSFSHTDPNVVLSDWAFAISDLSDFDMSTTLTPEDVNNSGFGVWIQFDRVSASADTVFIDYIAVTVEYELGGVLHQQMFGGGR